MDNNKEFKYVQFPLCLLMETYKANIESGLRLILRYGIMNYATKLKYDISDVAKQTAYYYYRKQEVMQGSVIDCIDEAINNKKFTLDEDYNGFSGYTFQPDDNISEILELFEEDPQFKKDCILNYQLHLSTSSDHLGISIASNDSLIEAYNKGVQIRNKFEDNFGPDAMPFCKKSMLFEFIENPKDIDLFRAYIGITSLIGQRNFTSTSKPVILSRMIGAKSKDANTYFSEDPKVKETIKKYSHRYWMDKLLFTLAQRKFIMYIAKKHDRKLFVSKYMEPLKLAELIKERIDMRDLKKLQNEALQHLYNTTS